jgi:glycerate kinase
MKIVVAPQAFKGSLSGPDTAKAIAQGIFRVAPLAQVVLIPVADGGDGTIDALVGSSGGQLFQSQVTGPVNKPVKASWGVMGDGFTAVIEMAKASGLALVQPHQRDPRVTTTYGTGQLIAKALDRGYRRIIVGLGGSATNDGGAGMAQALGARFMDCQGNELTFGCAALAQLASIDAHNIHPALQESDVLAATDVTNPLCGPTGASAIYSPQKGASPRMVEELDKALETYAQVIQKCLGPDLANVEGAGAAGGLGAGMMAFTGAVLRPGIQVVCEALDFDRNLTGADLVITGEGQVDASTAYNKAPVGVARQAKTKGIPVVLLAGSLGPGYQAVYEYGIDAVVSISDRPMSLGESLARTSDLLADRAEMIVRLMLAGGSFLRMETNYNT